MPDDSQKNNTTNEKDIEREPKSELERLKYLINVIKDGVYDINLQTDEIYVSSQYWKILGYATDEIQLSVKILQSLIHPDDLVYVIKIFDEYIQGIRDSNEFEYRIQTKSGEWCWTLNSATVVERDKNGKPLRLVGTLTDITEKKNAEIKLLESEEKFSKTFQMSPDPTVITTIEDGRFIDVNDAFLNTYRYTREEVINKKTIDLGTWDSPQQRDYIIQLIKQNGSIKDFEITSRKKNGEMLYGLFSASIVQLSTGPVLFSVIKDITERKQALDLLHIQKDLSIALAGATELKELGDYVLNAVTQLEGIDLGGFYLRDVETGELSLIANIGMSEGFKDFVSSFPHDSTIAQIVSKGEPYYKSYPELDQLNNTNGAKKFSITLPIKHENKVVADLHLISRTHYEISQGIREGLEAIAGIIGNAIARMRSETAIHEINARLKSILESPKDTRIFSLDTNYCYTAFNEKQREVMLARNNVDISVGMNKLSEKVNQNDILVMKNDFDRALKGESFVIIHYLEEGKYNKHSLNPIFEDDGRVVGLSCFIQDITEGKKAEDALIESEKKYSAIIETAAEGILIEVTGKKTVNYANSKICSMFGYTSEELTGKSIDDIHPEESISDIAAQVADLANGKIKIASSVPCLRKDGTIFFADVCASKLTLGGIQYTICFFTDITERKQAFDLLRIQKDLSVALAGTTELKELCGIVLKAAMQLDRIDSGSFHLRDIETGELRLIGHHGLSESFVEAISYFAPDSPMSQIVATGEPSFLSYLDINHTKKSSRLKEGLKLSFRIPIKHKDKVVAVLILVSHTHYELSDTIRESLYSIAGLLGSSVTRILSESAVREISARLKTVVESPKDIAIYSLDSNYCYTSFNKIHKKVMLSAFNTEIKIGMNALDIISASQVRTDAQLDYERVLNGERITKKYEISDYFYYLTLSPIFENDRKVIGIACFVQDITERILAEKALTELEKKYSTIIETAAEGILIVDTETKKFNYANAMICKMLGYNLEEFIGKSISDIHPKESLTHVMAQFKALIHDEFKVADSIPCLRKDGTVFLADIRGSILITNGIQYHVGFFNDVTERKQAEEALYQERNFISRIMETSPVVITAVNRDGQIFFANPAAERVLGIGRDEILNRAYKDPAWHITALDGNPFPEKELPFNRVRKEGKPVFNICHAIEDINGRRVLLSINAAPIYNAEGEFDGMVSAIEDITLRTELEEKIRQSEKLEAIGYLAGGIAHDFNNELSVIMGYSELLRYEVESNPELIAYVDNILKGIRRSADLISQMLAFSRKGKFLSDSVDIHEIISEIVIMLKHSIDKRIKIEKLLKAHPSTTLGDPSQLKSAILNLAINARDAMPDGGELSFLTEVVELNEEFYKNDPYNIELGKYLVVNVTDTGIGMNKETKNRIFEPFFTTKEKGKGTGLGLASVYGTVKNHKGMINVYSEEGSGTTFKVYLPLAAGILKEKKEIITHKAKPINISANILLVDDEDGLRIVGEKILLNFGCKVSLCKDGKEAVRFYKKYWRKIDLVILDMIMPVMNGRDAFIAMKKINPDIKALLTSGYSLNGEAQDILDKGVKDFLQKPFKKEELSRKIVEALSSKGKPAPSRKLKNQKIVKKKR